MRHYRAPRRPASGSSWQGQSSQSGGNITSDNAGRNRGGLSSSPLNIGGSEHPTHKQHLPVGHPGRVGPKQQVMSSGQINPIEMSNIWNILNTLGASGSDMGITSHP